MKNDVKKMCSLVLVSLIVIELAPVDTLLNTNVQTRFTGQVQEFVSHPVVRALLVAALGYLYYLNDMNCFFSLLLFIMLYR